jgi:hypothetical protein
MIDLLYTNGDSWTYGSELDDVQQAWPTLVAESLGVPLVNSGFPGGTNDRTVRTTVADCINLLSQNQKPHCCIAWTQLHRFELPMGDNYYNFVNPSDPDLPHVGKEIWQHWSSDAADVARWNLQRILLESFFIRHNISYNFFITYDQINRLTKVKQQAFDLIVQGCPLGQHGHPLQQGHEKIANYIGSQLRLPKDGYQYIVDDMDLSKQHS